MNDHKELLNGLGIIVAFIFGGFGWIYAYQIYKDFRKAEKQIPNLRELIK